jgi:hypothetical protein
MAILITAGLPCSAGPAPAGEMPREIRLWPDGVPGERVPGEPAEKVERGQDDIQRRSNVSDPRLVVHSLAPGDAGPRPAMIILPGGGYNILADDHEGGEVGRFLNGHGIVALTLLYRVPTGSFAVPDAGPVMDAQKAVSVVRERGGVGCRSDTYRSDGVFCGRAHGPGGRHHGGHVSGGGSGGVGPSRLHGPDLSVAGARR